VGTWFKWLEDFQAQDPEFNHQYHQKKKREKEKRREGRGEERRKREDGRGEEGGTDC
jgi:hypothetical protein